MNADLLDYSDKKRKMDAYIDHIDSVHMSPKVKRKRLAAAKDLGQ